MNKAVTASREETARKENAERTAVMKKFKTDFSSLLVATIRPAMRDIANKVKEHHIDIETGKENDDQGVHYPHLSYSMFLRKLNSRRLEITFAGNYDLQKVNITIEVGNNLYPKKEKSFDIADVNAGVIEGFIFEALLQNLPYK